MLRLARGLGELGIGKGDKVAVLLANCPEYILAWFALGVRGAVLVPVNTALKGQGLEYVLRQSDAVAILTSADHLPNLAPVLGELPAIRRRLWHGDGKARPGEDWIPLSDLLAGPGEHPPTSVAGPDVAVILYTSGTTGFPKGVMLSHHAYVHAGRTYLGVIEARKDDILHNCLPMFHINIQRNTIMGSLHGPLPMVLGERFSASRFWGEVRGQRATVVNTVGAMMSILYARPVVPEEREHAVRLMYVGAMPGGLWKPFEERFGVRIIDGYGLTESGGAMVTVNPTGAPRPGSIGLPLPCFEVAIVDGDGRRLPPRTPGEIVFRPCLPNLMMEGYYKMPEATARAFREGWFRTGDRGYSDGDGYYYFVDRIKDSIRRRGENVSSLEIESILQQHPAIAECAAVGVPSDLGEEEVKVAVVVKPGLTLTPEELVAWSGARLAAFMVPRYVEFLETLPRTETGRIQKFKLRSLGVANAWDRERAGGRVHG